MTMYSLLLVILLVFVPALGQSSFPTLLAEKPAPELREKLMLFGQFVGSWNFNGVEYHDDGSHPTDKGEIHFHWVLDGKAIQDVWRETERSDSGPRLYGTTVRFYDPKSDSWRITFIDPGLGVVRAMTARRVGSDIVIEGRLASGERTRWIFSDITPDSFHWHGEKFIGKQWHTYEELWARRVGQMTL